MPYLQLRIFRGFKYDLQDRFAEVRRITMHPFRESLSCEQAKTTGCVVSHHSWIRLRSKASLSKLDDISRITKIMTKRREQDVVIEVQAQEQELQFVGQ